MAFGSKKSSRESWSSRPLSMILPDNVKLFNKKGRNVMAAQEQSPRRVEAAPGPRQSRNSMVFTAPPMDYDTNRSDESYYTKTPSPSARLSTPSLSRADISARASMIGLPMDSSDFPTAKNTPNRHSVAVNNTSVPAKNPSQSETAPILTLDLGADHSLLGLYSDFSKSQQAVSHTKVKSSTPEPSISTPNSLERGSANRRSTSSNSAPVPFLGMEAADEPLPTPPTSLPRSRTERETSQATVASQVTVAESDPKLMDQLKSTHIGGDHRRDNSQHTGSSMQNESTADMGSLSDNADTTLDTSVDIKERPRGFIAPRDTPVLFDLEGAFVVPSSPESRHGDMDRHELFGDDSVDLDHLNHLEHLGIDITDQVDQPDQIYASDHLDQHDTSESSESSYGDEMTTTPRFEERIIGSSRKIIFNHGIYIFDSVDESKLKGLTLGADDLYNPFEISG